MLEDKYRRLEVRLGYTYQNKALLELALTHRSYKGANNERLEYLGDAILGYIIAEHLFNRFPNAKEGQLSRLRARLVKGVTLAEIAKEFGIGDYFLMGPGELKSGGYRRESILADGLESLIGAIYLDAGHDKTKEMVLAWYETRLESLSLEHTQKDPKTRLQEYLQAYKLHLPNYEVISTEGEAHDQTFHVRCVLDALDITVEGVGASRRYAEQEAARVALAQIEAKK